MAGHRIEAWLRLRDRARFARDAQASARNIREIGDAADDANQKTRPWNNALEYLQGLFTGASSVGGRTRIFGFAIGTVATALVAAVPLVVGLGGALVAVTGSLGAAAIGAGLLGGTLVTVLGASLGSVGLVLANAMSNFTNVNERFQTWRNAVAAFGQDSQQARTALERLNGVVATSGGPLVLRAVMAWQELRDEFTRRMEPITMKLFGAMQKLFGAARSLLPTLVKFTGVVVDALGPVMEGWLKFFTSAEFKSSLLAIGDAFARIAGPLGNGLLNIFVGLLRLVVRTLPFLGPVADGFESISDSFMDWARTADLSPFISQFNSWVGLLRAAGALIITILSGGASSGQGLVDSLTAVLDRWNAFLNTPAGQEGMLSFFQDAVDMTKAFAGFLAWLTGAIFGFGRAALPIYTKFFGAARDVWNQFMDALAPAKPFWDNILWPFIKGLAIGVGASLVAAFKIGIFIIKVLATVLGFLGTKLAFLKGPMELIGKIVGFLFGGPILKLLGGLGKLNVLLGPLGFAFRILYKPIALIGRIVGWVGGAFLRLGEFFGRLAGLYIPTLRAVWGRILGFIAGLGPKFFDAAQRLWFRMKDGFLQAVGTGLSFAGDIAKAVANAVIGLLNSAIPNSLPVPAAPDIDLPDNPIPLLASGGIVSGSGSWITGDAGPELNTLRGGRVTVQPLPAISAPGVGDVSVDPGGGKRILVSKIYLRGRQIAEAVADEVDDEVARQ